jgi:hypothetical protein
MDIMHDIERPSSPVAQILRSALPPGDPLPPLDPSPAPPAAPAPGPPAPRPPAAAGAAEAESELGDLMREGCVVLAQLSEGLAAGLIEGLEHAPESPLCAVIRRATPVPPAPEPAPAPAPVPAPAPAPAPGPAIDATHGGAGGEAGGEGIRPYVEAGPSGGRSRQLPALVTAEEYETHGTRREEAARRPSDGYDTAREKELQAMALRLESACAQLEEQKQAHDAAIQQVPPCGTMRAGELPRERWQGGWGADTECARGDGRPGAG